MKEAVRIESLFVPLALARDVDFAGEFLNRYRASSFRVAMRILGDRDAAEDVAQEALIRAFRSWDRFASLENQRAWVRRIVIRCALDVIERNPKHAELCEMQAHEEDANVLVRGVLEGMSPEHRVILGLAVGEQLSYKEIADTLDIPIGTVGSRIHTAKAAFRKAWEGER